MDVTLNKSDWSGEVVTVKVNKNTGGFNYLGYRFTLKKKRECGEVLWVLTGDVWTDPLATGHEFDGSVWFSSNGIDREDKDPFKAAIKLLSNII